VGAAFCGCNGGGGSSAKAGTSFYNSTGQVCSTGSPSPGCDYNSNGTKINESQDTYAPSEYNEGTLTGTLYGTWNANNTIWTSPDGVEYGCPNLNCSPPGLAINSFAGAGGTRDVDLQKANIQKQDLSSRAQFIADKFEMSLSASVQLVQLSDRMTLMMKQGQTTAQDREAITNAGLGIAGVSSSEVNEALTQGLNGDDTLGNALLSKAAKNLGMPSAANLRDQLLPALGVN
jgi:hypothetical protein